MKHRCKLIFLVFSVLTLALLLAAGCAKQESKETAVAGGGQILMASTIGPIDAGIVAALEDSFEKKTGIRVRHVGADACSPENG